MANEFAPEGTIFVCAACGKRSRDRYGEQAVDQGWDESCMLHAVLCRKYSLVMDNGRVVSAEAAEDAKAQLTQPCRQEEKE